MTIRRNRIGNRLNPEPPAVAKPPTRNFPVQQTIYALEEGLRAVNDRIAELQREHQPCDGSAEGKRAGFSAADRRTSQRLGRASQEN